MTTLHVLPSLTQLFSMSLLPSPLSLPLCCPRQATWVLLFIQIFRNINKSKPYYSSSKYTCDFCQTKIYTLIKYSMRQNCSTMNIDMLFYAHVNLSKCINVRSSTYEMNCNQICICQCLLQFDACL